jgi:hypothetical protein
LAEVGETETETPPGGGGGGGATDFEVVAQAARERATERTSREKAT